MITTQTQENPPAASEAPTTPETPKASKAKAPRKPKAAKAPKADKSVKKVAKKSAKPKDKKSPKAAKKGSKAPKVAKVPRKSSGKVNYEVGTEGREGKHSMTLDQGRKKPGTNPPKSEAHAKYGRAIAKARAAKGLTQRQLAEKTGLTQPGIANIERGVGGGTREETRKKLAKALGIAA